mmetsp:Transcript_19700/g.57224  ORF Transcript_19700/g.57224 Transcript_19700/m.57224 type:complete len:310 (-) Transcript_19700:1192-2121(-)
MLFSQIEADQKGMKNWQPTHILHNLANEIGQAQKACIINMFYSLLFSSLPSPSSNCCCFKCVVAIAAARSVAPSSITSFDGDEDGSRPLIWRDMGLPSEDSSPLLSAPDPVLPNPIDLAGVDGPEGASISASVRMVRMDSPLSRTLLRNPFWSLMSLTISCSTVRTSFRTRSSCMEHTLLRSCDRETTLPFRRSMVVSCLRTVPSRSPSLFLRSRLAERRRDTSPSATRACFARARSALVRLWISASLSSASAAAPPRRSVPAWTSRASSERAMSFTTRRLRFSRTRRSTSASCRLVNRDRRADHSASI